MRAHATSSLSRLTRFGWAACAKVAGRGRGFAFARYKNLGGLSARSRSKSSVDRETGVVRVVRAVAAVDSGEAVNPDGIRNQIEGGIIQSTSWTLYEEVGFDTQRVTSRDWTGYPILRFPGSPESVEVHVIDRPGSRFLGTGEAAGPGSRPPSPTRSPTRPACESASCRSIESGSKPRSVCELRTLPPCGQGYRI